MTSDSLGHPGPQLVLGEAAAHPAGAGPDQLAVVARLVAVAVPANTITSPLLLLYKAIFTCIRWTPGRG